MGDKPPEGVIEPIRRAFPGLVNKEQPTICASLPFDVACSFYVTSKYPPPRAYILASIRGTPEPGREEFANMQAGQLQRLQNSLGNCHVKTRLVQVEVEITWEDALSILQEVRASHADTLIAIGNDALIDLAKVVSYGHRSLPVDTMEHMRALLEPSETDAMKSNGYRLYRDDAGPYKPLDFICIPEDCGSASFSWRAHGFNFVRSKNSVLLRPSNCPNHVILDGEVTFGGTPQAWLLKGVESMNHAIEGLLSVNTNGMMNSMLTEALNYLCHGLLESKLRSGSRIDSRSIKARTLVLEGANLASAPLTARPQVLFGISHAVCEAAKDLFGISPGNTAAVVLPAALCWTLTRINIDKQSDFFKTTRVRQESVAQILWQSPVSAALFCSKGLNGLTYVGQLLRVFFKFLGLKDNLRDLGVHGKVTLDQLAHVASRDLYAQTAPVKMAGFPLAKDLISLVALPSPSPQVWL